ncbi:unnamed protein product [Rangifer tarandus platyrhynchus]|uniref:Uncharacterized protein n=1 Tax=Rangifer tarandus platyrhynchus TaxID=3082113 RepID=A0ABN9A598_RANTA|nr:unnamed protein product [Rangifer tarandus platyrhynchus]
MLFFLILVIYKKFQLGCTVGHNETAVDSMSSPNLPTQGLNTSCEAQMFTADSQIGVLAYVYALHCAQVLRFCPTLHSAQSGARCSTQCPLWLLPLSATLKCCPSIQNSAGPPSAECRLWPMCPLGPCSACMGSRRPLDTSPSTGLPQPPASFSSFPASSTPHCAL